ncbi:MAG: nucleotidyltransferase domain-containing protein [Patescibacteria group bacterium]
MSKVKTTPCKLAIKKTLAYSGVFKYPLTYYQLISMLISKDGLNSKQVKRELKKQTKEDLIDKVDDKYILHGVEPIDWDKRKENTENILKRNKKVLEYIARIPWIKMIAVTGSVANYNAEEKSDIDLLFVTSKDRVWLTRGFVFLTLSILNKLPKEHENREICPNIFIDESKLPWTKKRRNLYVAQNIISMQPIFEKENMYFKFIYENRWIRNYYPNFKINYPDDFSKLKLSKSILMKFIEKIAMISQLIYMKKRMTTETITNKLIHFNKNDNSRWILKSYKKLLKSNF